MRKIKKNKGGKIDANRLTLQSFILELVNDVKLVRVDVGFNFDVINQVENLQLQCDLKITIIKI